MNIQCCIRVACLSGQVCEGKECLVNMHCYVVWGWLSQKECFSDLQVSFEEWSTSAIREVQGDRNYTVLALAEFDFVWFVF